MEYKFKMNKKIEHCRQCPMLSYSGMDDPICGYTGSKIGYAFDGVLVNCPLVLVEEDYIKLGKAIALAFERGLFVADSYLDYDWEENSYEEISSVASSKEALLEWWKEEEEE